MTDTRAERLPRPQRPAPDAESGRGLLLAAALADRWGVNEGAHPRKTVRAEPHLTAPDRAPTRPGSSTGAGS